MSSYCFDDKRENSTRGMAQQCQNRVTLASTSRPPAGRVLAARLVLPGSLVDALLGEVEQPILAASRMRGTPRSVIDAPSRPRSKNAPYRRLCRYRPPRGRHRTSHPERPGLYAFIYGGDGCASPSERRFGRSIAVTAMWLLGRGSGGLGLGPDGARGRSRRRGRRGRRASTSAWVRNVH